MLISSFIQLNVFHVSDAFLLSDFVSKLHYYAEFLHYIQREIIKDKSRNVFLCVCTYFIHSFCLDVKKGLLPLLQIVPISEW